MSRGSGVVVAITILVTAAACWPTEESLEPYPCAKDGTCGGSAWCAPDIGCIMKSSLGGPCRSTADCGDGQCTYGVCVTTYSGRAGQCRGGTVKVPYETQDQACLPDCGAGQTCAPGSSCEDVFGCGDQSCNQVVARACVGKQAAAILDRPCQGATCGESPYQCESDACVLACGRSTTCPAGRFCVFPSSTDATGGCLLDCSSGARCPDGLSCQSVGGGKMACAGAGAAGSISACKSVSDTQSCGTNFHCGFSSNAVPYSGCCTTGKDNTLPDGTCPVNAPPGGNGYQQSGCGVTHSCYCQCLPGYQGVECSTGAPCTADVCTGKTWGCRPTNTPGCTTDTDGFSGTCNCTSGKSVPFQCGGGQTCEQLCAKAG